MTTFANTWNATYISTPADLENINLGAGRIRDTRGDLTARMQVDHSWAGDANDGAHNQVTLRPQASDPVYSTGGDTTAGFFYTKVTNGGTELFFKDAAGHVMQITSNGGGGQPGDLYQSLATSRAGCVMCDGTSYAQTGIYAALYAILGTAYNQSGDAAGTFRVPDYRGCALVGAGTGAKIIYGTTAAVTVANPGKLTYTKHNLNTAQAIVYTSSGPIGGLTSGTTYYVIVVDANTIELASSVANALAGTGIQFTNQGTANWILTYNLSARTLGDKFGEESHTISTTEMPAHSHTVTDPGHAHNLPLWDSAGTQVNKLPNDITANNNTATITTNTATTGITIASAGGNTPHNTAQPSAVVNIFIHL